MGNDDIVEILISDNASEDNTSNIASRYAHDYKNFIYYRNREKVGLSKAVKHSLTSMLNHIAR